MIRDRKDIPRFKDVSDAEKLLRDLAARKKKDV